MQLLSQRDLPIATAENCTGDALPTNMKGVLMRPTAALSPSAMIRKPVAPGDATLIAEDRAIPRKIAIAMAVGAHQRGRDRGKPELPVAPRNSAVDNEA